MRGDNANLDMAAGRRADGAASRAHGGALLRAVLLRGCPRQPVAACRRSRTGSAGRGTVSGPAAHRDRHACHGVPARRPGGPAAVPRHPLLPGRAQLPDAALPADAELLAVRGRGDTPARSGPWKLADRTPPAALPARRRRFRPGAIVIDSGHHLAPVTGKPGAGWPPRCERVAVRPMLVILARQGRCRVISGTSGWCGCCRLPLPQISPARRLSGWI